MTEQAPFVVRAPHSGDVEALARVHVQAWLETYGDQLPDEFFGAKALEFRRRQWRGLVADTAPESITVVVERGGEVVGFAHAGLPD